MNIVKDFFKITNPEEDNENSENQSDETSLEKQQVEDTDDENETKTVEDDDESDDDKTDEEDKSGDDSNAEDDDEQGEETQDEDDSDEEDSDDEELMKLQGYEEKNVLVDYHPEVVQISEEELQTYSKVVRDNNGKIIDPFHKTIPIMTKYEKAKIIGIRAQQINSGSEPFIQVDANMIDGLTIANEELLKRKIPFIIRRPMPNGSSEYWNISDLELLE